jgi:ribosome maturation factor RimP
VSKRVQFETPPGGTRSREKGKPLAITDVFVYDFVQVAQGSGRNRMKSKKKPPLELLLSLLLFVLCTWTVSSWVQPLRQQQQQQQRRRRRRQRTSCSSIKSSTDNSADPQQLLLLQDEGNRLIREAALQAGCADDQISIQWKGGSRLIVTVMGPTYLQDDWADEEEEYDTARVDLDNDDDVSNEVEPSLVVPQGVNLVAVSKAIQSAFGVAEEGSVAFQIAANYDIEVSTPGASNVLNNSIMFESYRGFEVTVDFADPKTKKNKILVGRLVERNAEFTVINISGRMKNIRNDIIQSVTLPKARKEKSSG